MISCTLININMTDKILRRTYESLEKPSHYYVRYDVCKK